MDRILIIMKNKWPECFISFTWAIFHNIQKRYWNKQQISGERLQDHWYSGYNILLLFLCLRLFERFIFTESLVCSRPKVCFAKQQNVTCQEPEQFFMKTYCLSC